jgi:hypothetical protein
MDQQPSPESTQPRRAAGTVETGLQLGEGNSAPDGYARRFPDATLRAATGAAFPSDGEDSETASAVDGDSDGYEYPMPSRDGMTGCNGAGLIQGRLRTRIVGCDNSCSYIIAFGIAALSAVRALPRDAVRLGPGRHSARTVAVAIIRAQETNAMRS